MIAKDDPLSPVSVIGRGRLGGALASALEARGAPVTHLPGRSGVPATPLVLLAVPDDAVAATAERIAGALPHATPVRTALHLAGALSSAALAPLAARGIAVGSCHPMQTFPPGAGPERFRGVTFALEGDEAARGAGRALAETLGGAAIEIPAERKVLWHLAASLTANGAVGLVAAGLEALEAAGLDEAAARRALAPLVTAAVAEAFARGPVGALTGPAARGDAETLARHRAAVLRWDATRTALFEALVREQARIAARRKKP